VWPLFTRVCGPQILGNRGSHGFSSVLSTLFTNASKMDIDSLWDSDVNLKCAQFIHSLPRPPYQHLNESLTIHDENNIRGRSWHPTIIAALIQLLKRKKSNAHPKQGENYAFIGDGLTRGVLMSLAGRLDGNVFPCDTRVTGCVTRRMETIFRQHCAVEVDGMILGDPSGLPPPQTLMTRDGVVLGLRDDLTAPLIKVLRRCGGGIDLKHFCIGKVWQGKTNKESYEAEFNVSRREGRGDTAILGAECMGVFSSIFETLQVRTRERRASCSEHAASPLTDDLPPDMLAMSSIARPNVHPTAQFSATSEKFAHSLAHIFPLL